MTRFYFAYGSNMDEAQMKARLPEATKVGTGVLRGHEFIFSGYSVTRQGSVANVRKKAGSRVFGVVYAVPSHGLAALDRFEGYPTSYQRKRATIYMTGGGTVSASLYYKKRAAADAPPNPAYVQQILRALARHQRGSR